MGSRSSKMGPPRPRHGRLQRQKTPSPQLPGSRGRWGTSPSGRALVPLPPRPGSPSAPAQQSPFHLSTFNTLIASRLLCKHICLITALGFLAFPLPFAFKTLIMPSEALPLCLIACFRLEILARRQRLQCTSVPHMRTHRRKSDKT